MPSYWESGDDMDEFRYHTVMESVCLGFNLGSLLEINERLNGSYNVTVKIKTSHGRFVVRILNAAGKEEHLKVLQPIMHTLHEAAVPVPVPLITEEGASYMFIEGSFVQVLPFVEGNRFDCRKKQVIASGKMLRRFHEVLKQHQVNVEPASSFYRSNDYYITAIEQLRQVEGIPLVQWSHMNQLSERILSQWERAAKEMPEAIMHGDWHFWNQLYAPDDRVISVMDFDYMQTGLQIYDLAYALWVIYILLPKHATSFDRQLLLGYGKLSSQEREILPIAVARIGLFFLCHTATATDPIERWNAQYQRQIPLLDWLQRDGRKRLQIAD